MRSLSAAALADIFAQETGSVWLVLLTIEEASLAAPIRLVNDASDLVSNGNTFTAFPFEPVLAGEDPERLTRASIRVDNVARELIQMVREATPPVDFTLQVVRRATPDTVEFEQAFALAGVRYDAFSVEFDLAFKETLNTGMPAHSFTPATTPGIF